MPALICADVAQRWGIQGQKLPWRLEEICGLDTVGKGEGPWELFRWRKGKDREEGTAPPPMPD